MLRTSTYRRSCTVVVVVSLDVTLSQNVSVPVALAGTATVWYNVPFALLELPNAA